MRATAKFTNLSHDQSPYDKPGEGPPLSRAKIRRKFDGDMIGESDAELIVCQTAENRIGYVGADRFTGRLANRAGAFVFQHGGIIDKSGFRPFGYIVPGSATGELHGLRGEAIITVTAAGEHTLTLDYEFEES